MRCKCVILVYASTFLGFKPFLREFAIVLSVLEVWLIAGFNAERN